VYVVPTERLFSQFDTKNQHCIDMDEFVTGLAIICRGSMDDKIHFLFAMYDVSHENCVSKGELATLINQCMLHWSV
jgi:Ca2+-binding EF-hand superfamily protein